MLNKIHRLNDELSEAFQKEAEHHVALEINLIAEEARQLLYVIENTKVEERNSPHILSLIKMLRRQFAELDLNPKQNDTK